MASVLDELARSMPTPSELRDRLRSLAMLDAICGTRHLTYSYTSSFSDGVALARYENGAGDEYFVFFDGADVFVRVFDHESELSPYANDGLWPGLIEGLPARLEKYVQMDRLGDEDYPRITLALWHEGNEWRHGAPAPIEGREPRPTAWPLGQTINWSVEAVAADRGRYWSRSLEADDVASILALQPVSPPLAQRLDPDVDWAFVERVAAYGGYPLAP
jgi:hypothetical protein